MDFEEYYGAQEANWQKENASVGVRQYNTWVRLIREHTSKMLESAEKNPPKYCDWVEENSTKKVSWQLWTDYDQTESINLMPDGRLVRVSHDSQIGPAQVRSTIILREMTQWGEYEDGDLRWDFLAELFESIASSGLGKFNLPVGDLLGATRQNWGQPWSNYK